MKRLSIECFCALGILEGLRATARETPLDGKAGNPFESMFNDLSSEDMEALLESAMAGVNLDSANEDIIKDADFNFDDLASLLDLPIPDEVKPTAIQTPEPKTRPKTSVDIDDLLASFLPPPKTKPKPKPKAAGKDDDLERQAAPGATPDQCIASGRSAYTTFCLQSCAAAREAQEEDRRGRGGGGLLGVFSNVLRRGRGRDAGSPAAAPRGQEVGGPSPPVIASEITTRRRPLFSKGIFENNIFGGPRGRMKLPTLAPLPTLQPLGDPVEPFLGGAEFLERAPEFLEATNRVIDALGGASLSSSLGRRGLGVKHPLFIPDSCMAECVETVKSSCRGFVMPRTFMKMVAEATGQAPSTIFSAEATPARSEVCFDPNALVPEETGGGIAGLFKSTFMGNSFQKLPSASGCCQEFGSECFVNHDTCEQMALALCTYSNVAASNFVAEQNDVVRSALDKLMNK